MAALFGFPVYRREKKVTPEIMPKIEAQIREKDTILQQVLKHYPFQIKDIKETGLGTLVESPEGTFCLWKNSNIERLTVALAWQEYLNQQESKGVLELIKTSAGENWVKINEEYYFITPWPQGEAFMGENPLHLKAVVRELNLLNQQSKDFTLPQTNEKEGTWPKMIQERINDLLNVQQYLDKKRHKTAFEMIYLENFDFIYEQGQEAINNMILAGYANQDKQKKNMLLNCFLPERLIIYEGQTIFLDLSQWSVGTEITDLALFLNSYLPLHRWNEELFKNLVKEYEKDQQLSSEDKRILMALLRFPNRYWLYTYQYYAEQDSQHNLLEKMKKYIRECYWRDMCLDNIESWLWEG